MDEQSNVNAFIRVISDKLFPGDGTLLHKYRRIYE